MAAASSSSAVSSSPALNVEACGKLIDLVWNWDHMQMFHEAVSDAVVPGYSAVISDPIDLTTMRAKLARSGGAAAAGGAKPSSASTKAADGVYSCDTELVNDLDLMITNALTFNTAGTVWYAHAKELRKRLMVPSTAAAGGANASSATGAGAQQQYGDFITKSGVVVDEEELVYVDNGTKKESYDYSKSMRKEEKKKSENIASVLSAMQSDLEIPIEELRKRFAAAAAATAGKKRSREEEASSSSSSSGSSSGSSDDGSSDDDEEDSSDDEENSSDAS